MGGLGLHLSRHAHSSFRSEKYLQQQRQQVWQLVGRRPGALLVLHRLVAIVLRIGQHFRPEAGQLLLAAFLATARERDAAGIIHPAGREPRTARANPFGHGSLHR